jgi:aryl-alcohol dehydrogenase-like predicted oxidoreductase
MEQRPLGNTGLRVSALGLGAGHIGSPGLPEKQVERLLHAALDHGVTLLDTARSYGLSEERIGRHLAWRRNEFVLSTKGGYGIAGHEDWTGPGLRAGIDEALRRLRTDRIDLMHLHSCPAATLRRQDVLAALEEAVRAGKVRVAAYSGDNEPLEQAIGSGRFGSVQCSVNLCDQRALERAVPEAAGRGLGVIAKRPLANAPWRHAEPPAAPDVRLYWERFRALALDPHGLDLDELALRFAAFEPGVSSCIAGTSEPGHLLRCIELVERGPLPGAVQAHIRGAFGARGKDWEGQI